MVSEKGSKNGKLSAKNCVAIIKKNPNDYFDLPTKMQERVSVVQAFIECDSHNVWRISQKAYDAWRTSRLAKKWIQEQKILSLPTSLKALVPTKPDPDACSTQGSMIPVCEESAIDPVTGYQEDPLVQPVYYISDLHIEHQIDLLGKSFSEIQQAVRDKANELAASVTTDRGVIVIAGDIADSVYLNQLFISSFCASLPRGGRSSLPIVAALGNHEFWNVGSDGPLSVDELVGLYKNAYRSTFAWNLYLAHNELLLSSVDGPYQTFSTYGEDEILGMDEEELYKCVKNSSVVILAGVGFTGGDLQSSYISGMYGTIRTKDGRSIPRLSTEEDEAQSARFRALHDKLQKCAGDLPLIVVTHTPMRCWSNDAPNPGWVYISGHTHQNTIVRSEDGTCVLSDNQIGYETRPCRFKAFTWKYGSDPFDDWGDGTYEISAREYRQFNYGRGIEMTYKDDRAVIMLKRDGVYMFFVNTPRGLRMLEGGRKHIVDHDDIKYYYDNLGRYHELVMQAFNPYRQAIEDVSAEVRCFGGSGLIHGCIIDIDFLNHIYLNPFDGSLVPYVALDTRDKSTYKNVQSLIMGTRFEHSFLEAVGKGQLPLLAGHSDGRRAKLANVPRVVLDTEMYEPSRIMRAVQYVFDKGVVRIWNDDVLKLGHDSHEVEEAEGNSFNNKRVLKENDLLPGSC